MTETQISLLVIAALMTAVLVAGLLTGTIITTPASGLVRRDESPLQFWSAVATDAVIVGACVLWAIFGTFG